MVELDAYFISTHFAYNKEKVKELTLDAAENTGAGLVVT